jgi:glucokinase
MILYAYDPALIVVGGSVSKAWSFYEKAVWEELEGFYFKKALQQLRIEVSQLEHSGVLGAAALFYNEKGTVR